MPIPPELIDPDAQKVIRRLVRAHHQAYLVGGCVRDLLLERTPKDFDIATSATPPEVKALFRNCRIIGRRFRLAHIFFGSKIIETATFRANPRESEPEPPVGEGGEERVEPAEDLLIRHDNVFGTAEEDARRRDFTINGLFYDLEADQVIDYVGGLADLASRTVRTIGDPDIRFREDPVRILRAIKFAARLDFTIEPSAWQAIMSHKREIPKCAPPRVLEELYRLLRGGAARRSMELLLETGILALLIPELQAHVAGPDADPTAAKWWWQALERLDTQLRAGRMPSNAVLLCVLCGPFVGPEAFEDSEGKVRDVGQLIDERTRALLERMRVSRRDSERARQILLAQRRIAPSKRRRGRPMALVRRDYFQEALQVYSLLAPVLNPTVATDEEVARWSKLAADAEREGPAAFEENSGDARPGEEPRRRRRRRRGGRRRRHGGGGGPGGPPPPDTMAAKGPT
jgi:poly(A) polymerase